MNIAIVTGATSGLGRAFLEEWAAQGARFDEVWLVSRHADALERVAAALPWQARCFAIDLSAADERAQLFAALRAERPQVQALVNAAGYGKIGQVAQIAPDEQSGMVDLNCTALVDLTQRALPFMAAAFLPQPGFAVYAATKAFVLSFSRALAAEQKSRGVRVVAVCPNPMHTAFFERAGEKPNLFKLLFFEKPRNVARAAMRDAAKGRDVSTNCRMAPSSASSACSCADTTKNPSLRFAETDFLSDITVKSDEKWNFIRYS